MQHGSIGRFFLPIFSNNFLILLSPIVKNYRKVLTNVPIILQPNKSKDLFVQLLRQTLAFFLKSGAISLSKSYSFMVFSSISIITQEQVSLPIFREGKTLEKYLVLSTYLKNILSDQCKICIRILLK
ncbi:hypothetical protein [Bartonella acomydis]|uniref:Uncharacterized protein n=1 Tax=Bartonella acomydis TaxID=686234 RepID=A0ABP9N1D2_9HYPH